MTRLFSANQRICIQRLIHVPIFRASSVPECIRISMVVYLSNGRTLNPTYRPLSSANSSSSSTSETARSSSSGKTELMGWLY